MDVTNQTDAEKLAKQVGHTLRKIRQERGLTLQQLVDVTDVSKLTLSKIERGEANPSLTVIWKIANGLQIPISFLLNDTSEIKVSRAHTGNKVISANKACTLEPMFDTSTFGSSEIHRAFLQPNSEYNPGAHQTGVIEYVTVMHGQLTLKIEDDYYHLSEYDSIKFHGDKEHTYINPSNEKTVLHFVMTYLNSY
ncbi:helix-turn-helix domain-containing protein [Halalkalibacter wakoensis]|nr:XRE family transcriptional regulator [Halalkalibacter wakoensis]